ncbi:AraC family ligand binding domain-containing protein [Pseudoalteromonas sp. SCSIO 43210]
MEDKLYQIDKGTLVLMNPDAVHACNPNQNSPWAYYMMHVDKSWLAQLLVKFNIRASNHWCNSQPDTLTTPVFYQQFVLVCETLCRISCLLNPSAALVKRFTDILNHGDI